MTAKREAEKDDAGKLRYDLMPPFALNELVRVFSCGAEKYGERNWEAGLDWSRLYAAAQRHLWSWWAGEDADPETSLNHQAHAAWYCLALLEFARTHPERDDRQL